jgi:hypothetical protein
MNEVWAGKSTLLVSSSYFALFSDQVYLHQNFDATMILVRLCCRSSQRKLMLALLVVWSGVGRCCGKDFARLWRFETQTLILLDLLKFLVSSCLKLERIIVC